MAMVNRNFKDTVFRMIFGKNRKALLSLYNAVNGSDYTDPNELVINTLEDAVYVSRKNDMSFVFRHTLNLYEHQSTLNPNLPLRNFFYVADLLQSMIDRTELYGSKRKKIDAPHFIMFYNGKEPLTVTEYRLSEMYSIPETEPQLELIVKVVNINAGQDDGILSRCKTLEEYADYIATVRRFSEKYPLDEAVPMAVDDCIRRGILRDFLEKQKAQVIKVSIYEITEEEYKEVLRRDAREDGIEIGFGKGLEEGMEKGMEKGELCKMITLVRKKMNKGKPLAVIADELEETEANITPLYQAILAAGEDTSVEEIAEQILGNDQT